MEHGAKWKLTLHADKRLQLYILLQAKDTRLLSQSHPLCWSHPAGAFYTSYWCISLQTQAQMLTSLFSWHCLRRTYLSGFPQITTLVFSENRLFLFTAVCMSFRRVFSLFQNNTACFLQAAVIHVFVLTEKRSLAFLEGVVDQNHLMFWRLSRADEVRCR